MNSKNPPLVPYSAATGSDRVPFGLKLALGVGGFPFFTASLAIQYIAQPIYQIVLGLSPMLFGLAMTIPRVIDAFTDPVMGYVSDNTRSRFGRRRPYIFLGALLMALTFSLVWLVPRGWGQTGLFIYLTATTVLFFLAFTLFSVPLTSLSYEITPDYHERTRVMAFWGFFATAANLAVNWYAPATQWSGFSDAVSGARWVGIAIGVFVFGALGVIPALFVRERFAGRAEGLPKVGFWAAVRQTGSSRAMLMLVCLIFALNFCGTIAGSIAQYIVIYHVVGGDLARGLFLNSLNGTGFAVVGFAFIPVITWLSSRIGKRGALHAVLALATAGGISKWFIFTPAAPSLLLLDSLLNGPVWVALGVLVPSMMADICDDDEWRYGLRREGMISSVFMWITKVGLSFTFLVSGVALTISGFDASLGTAQPPGTLTTMRMFFVLSSVFAPLLGIVCLAFYPITEASAKKTRALIEERRGRV